MIIFDKIKKALFTEVEEEEYVEDVSAEEKLEKVESEKSVVYKKITRPRPKPEDMFDPEPVEEPFYQEPIKSSIDIKVDVPAVEKKPPVRRLKPIERKEFEMPQVISPINGMKEMEQHKQADYIPTTKPKNRKDSLGTVISPYYGDGELEEFHNKAQMNIITEKFKDNEEHLIDADEIENVSLDEIVSNDTVDEDEMIQFSLFGENTSLRDLKEIDEVEEEFPANENVDDLPF